MKLRQDRPDLRARPVHGAPRPVPCPSSSASTMSVFWSTPNIFRSCARSQLRWTVGRTIQRAARILTGSEFSRDAIVRNYGEACAGKIVVVPNAAAERSAADVAGGALRRRAGPVSASPSRSFFPWVTCSRARITIGLIDGLCRIDPGLSAIAASPGAGRQRYLVQPAYSRSGAAVGARGPHPVSPVSSPTRISCISTTPATFSSFRRSMKASACRCSKPWRAGGRWPARARRPCPKWRTAPVSCSIPIPRREMVRAMADLLLDAELARAYGASRPAAGRAFQLARDGAENPGSLSRSGRAPAVRWAGSTRIDEPFHCAVASFGLDASVAWHRLQAAANRISVQQRIAQLYGQLADRTEPR